MTPTSKVCKDCGAPVSAPYRKLCWSCQGYHKRYGVSKKEYLTRRRLEGHLCVICATPTKGVLHFGGKNVCRRCYNALDLFSNPIFRARLIEELGQ